MPRAATAILLCLGFLLTGAAEVAAQTTPPVNVRPTPHPPDIGARPLPSPIARLPGTSTRYGSGESSVTDAAFTDVTRTVTVVPGVAELGGVRPVAVSTYVSGGQLGPR